MNKAILIFFFLIGTASYSQTIGIITDNSIVYLKNNTVLNGRTRIGTKGLRIKHNSDKFKVYMGKEIDSVLIPIENGVCKFVYLPLKYKNGKYKDFRLMQPILIGEKISIYNYGEAVFLGEGLGVFGKDDQANFLYAIRRNEKTPTFIGSNYGFHKGFKKEGPEYFKDCPALVSKINDGVFTKENVLDAINFYENNCNE
jgi:hypothetical protein